MGTRLPICRESEVGSKPIYPAVISIASCCSVPGMISWIMPRHLIDQVHAITGDFGRKLGVSVNFRGLTGERVWVTRGKEMGGRGADMVCGETGWRNGDGGRRKGVTVGRVWSSARIQRLTVQYCKKLFGDNWSLTLEETTIQL